MRLAHLSDLHFTCFTLNPLRLFPKRIISHLNWFLHRKEAFSEELIEKLPDLLSSLKVDLVLLSGDFTTSSMPEEFDLAKKFTNRLSMPFLAIPGNHDHYTRRSHLQKRFYNYFPSLLSSLAKEGVEAHKIGMGFWVVSLDTCPPNSIFSSRGSFSTQQEAKLENLLLQIPKEDKILLLNHYPFFQQEHPKKILERGEALEALIRRDPRIVLYLHGHTHRHAIADLRPSGLPIVLDSGSCRQKVNGSWNLLDIEETKCAITAYRWNSEWEAQNKKEFIWK